MRRFKPIDTRFDIVDAIVAARLQKVFRFEVCLVTSRLMQQATLRILRVSSTQEIKNDNNTEADGRASGYRSYSQVSQDFAASRAREKSQKANKA
jgi:hypothetical protein